MPRPRRKRVSSDKRLAVTSMEFIEVDRPEDFIKQVKSIKGRRAKFFWIGAFTCDSFEQCARKVICMRPYKDEDVDKTFTHCFISRVKNVKFKSDWILNITGLGLRTKKITAKLAPGYLFLLQKLDVGPTITASAGGGTAACFPGMKSQNVLALENKSARRKKRPPSRLPPKKPPHPPPSAVRAVRKTPQPVRRTRPVTDRTRPTPDRAAQGGSVSTVRRRRPRRNEYLDTDESGDEPPRKKRRPENHRPKDPLDLLDEAGIPMEPSQEDVEGVENNEFEESPEPFEPAGTATPGMKSVNVRNFLGTGRKRRTRTAPKRLLTASNLRRRPMPMMATPHPVYVEPLKPTYVGRTACSIPSVPSAKDIRKRRSRAKNLVYVKKKHLTVKPGQKKQAPAPKPSIISSSKGGARGISRLSAKPRPKTRQPVQIPAEPTQEVGEIQWIDEDEDLAAGIPMQGDLEGELTDFSDSDE